MNTLYDVFICIADFFELADVGFEILILAAIIHNLTTILIRQIWLSIGDLIS